MKRCLMLAGIFLGLVCGLRAQVTDTTVCDVVKNPAPFDGKMVRIKGTVVAGFDEFVIKDAADPNCGYPVNAIWLSYPQGTRGKAGPAAILTLQPARNFTGKYTPPSRTAVTLEKNKDFKQFDSLLAQVHQKGLGICLGCTRYEVTATLIGRLDAVADPAVKRDPAGKIIGFVGFGNMNAYPSRLVLQSVADVTPKEVDYSKSDSTAKGDAPLTPPNVDIFSAIVTAQRLAASLGASAAKDEAVKSAAVYGKESEHTGVTANFGTTNEVPNEALGAKDSPDGVLFNCTFSSDRLQGPAILFAVLHIGDHVSELRSPPPGTVDSPAFVLESNAWVVTTVAAVGSGQKLLTLPGGYQLWNMSWSDADRNDKMESAFKDYLANEAQLGR